MRPCSAPSACASRDPPRQTQRGTRMSGLEPCKDRSPRLRPHGCAGTSASSVTAVPVPDHVLGDRRLGDLEPELQQFTMDARRAPQWILLAHPSDEFAQLRFDFGPARLTAGFPAPIGPKPRSMPPQDCIRLNDTGQDRQAWPDPGHPHHQGAITAMQPQTVWCTPQAGHARRRRRSLG